MEHHTGRDEFPGEWKGRVDTRLDSHENELKAIRELITTLTVAQNTTREELGRKIDHVASVIDTAKRALMIVVGIVGFVIPIITVTLTVVEKA